MPKKGSKSAKQKTKRKPATAEVPASAVKSPREDKDNAEESDEVVEPLAAAGLYNFDDSTESKSDEDLTSEAEEEPPKKQSKHATPMSAEVLSILPKDT
eukprot:SAG31_NODE_396_length_16264_cov_17.206496_2_plen_99_part_00